MGRALRTGPADTGRRGGFEGAEAADIAVRDANHRALPASGKLGRGGAAGDVLRWGVDAAGRGHHGCALGRPREPQHHQRPEPEGIREDRRVAEPSLDGRPRLRVAGRDLAEAQLGRRGPQRFRSGGHRRGGRRLSGSAGRAGRDEGGQGELVGLSEEPAGPRGLKGTELFVTDKCQGLVESVGEIFPEARWQRCVVHW